jgi:pimeloyl-ACP methyl ester carboxylesterase
MTTAFEQVRLRLDAIELAGWFHGPVDGMPVIALHGWLDNANTFARLAAHLDGMRVLALDFAGHGLSDHRPAGSSYPHWEYARDLLQVADHLGWARFSLIGHSMGAIVAAQLAAAMPDRLARLALIEGVVSPDAPPHNPAERLGKALREQLAQGSRRKPLYADRSQAVRARCTSRLPVTESAAGLLAERGLMAVEGGFTWRSDNRLTLTTPVRLEPAQALEMVRQVQCPALLVVAEQGLLVERPHLLEGLPFKQVRLPGRHHLHLDDDEGAALVAACINSFFTSP